MREGSIFPFQEYQVNVDQARYVLQLIGGTHVELSLEVSGNTGNKLFVPTDIGTCLALDELAYGSWFSFADVGIGSSLSQFASTTLFPNLWTPGLTPIKRSWGALAAGVKNRTAPFCWRWRVISFQKNCFNQVRAPRHRNLSEDEEPCSSDSSVAVSDFLYGQKCSVINCGNSSMNDMC